MFVEMLVSSGARDKDCTININKNCGYGGECVCVCVFMTCKYDLEQSLPVTVRPMILHFIKGILWTKP